MITIEKIDLNLK